MPHQQSLSRQAYIEAATTTAFRLLAGSTIITALALALKAGHLAIGLVGSIPYLTRLAQPLATPVSRRFGSRRTAVYSALFERLFLLACVPTALLSFHPLALTLFFFTLSQAAGSLFDGCLTLVYAQTIPDEDQPSFYSRKQRWLSFSSLVIGIFVGLLINQFHTFLPPLVFYTAILALTTLLSFTIFQTLSCFFKARSEFLYDPNLPPTPEHTDTYPVAIAERPTYLNHPYWRRYFLFAAFWGLAFGLNTRHQEFFYLTHLHFSIGTLIIFAGLGSGAAMLSAPFWGRLTGRFGPKSTLTWILFFIITNPLWAIMALSTSPDIIYLGSFISGLASSGYAVATILWITRSVPDAGAPLYNTFITILGIATGVGPLIGGYFLNTFAPYGEQNAYVALFILTILMRLVAFIYFRRIPAPAETGPEALPAAVLNRLRAASLTSVVPGFGRFGPFNRDLNP